MFRPVEYSDNSMEFRKYSLSTNLICSKFTLGLLDTHIACVLSSPSSVLREQNNDAVSQKLNPICFSVIQSTRQWQ